MSQPCQQIIATHIVPNISRGKANQTMKFGQFIEIIFLKKHAGNNAARFL